MKKPLTIFILSLALLPALVLADASSSIELPTDFVAQMWAQAQSAFTGVSSFVEAIVGVLLALVVIEALIITLRNPNK